MNFLKPSWHTWDTLFPRMALKQTLKIGSIRDRPRPHTVTDVRSFWGFTNHYRKFLKGFAQIACPLNKLTSGEYSNKKKHPIDWDNACEESFLKLKELCTSTPVLAYVDYSKPFKLHTDASCPGFGAVLYQTMRMAKTGS